MELYKKKSRNIDGVEFQQIEELVVYDIKNKEEHKKVVDKLNAYLGFAWHKVNETEYPYTLVVDLLEELHIKNKLEEK